MIKLYCDRCGKECATLSKIKIPNERYSVSFQTKTIQVCSACEKEADKIYDKLTDIRFILFKDFLKGGAE